ncbi:MAG TPA: hypothetical protein VNK26_01260, partial [Pyrinomonadaceae bacterium]|nr:hypothetical protein [Pyrinomonadaceae bacterium]
MSSEREIAENGSEPKKRRRGRLRLAGIILLGLAGVLLLLAAIVFFAFKSGFADSYIKNQFVETLASMGVTFRAEKFALQATPLALELENAEFYNSKTRQPLASIKKGRIEFTITDLFAWRLTREIRVESTELNGAQFWIIFDENGRSNFADIVQTSGPSRINLKYESAAVKVINSAIHFGDGQRAISFDAENVSADIAPAVDDSLFEEPRYQINIAGLSATAVYETRRTENIDFTIRAVADSRGADIQDLRVDSPLGSAVLSGKISNWQSFEYDLNLDGSLDLAKTGYFLGLEAAVGGDGTFKGKLKGQGEDFRIEAELGSQKLILDNILVKNLGSNISATIRGAEYAAQGKAFAD